jgi:DNA-binding LacI/PurR family transcriptional regulator
MPVYEMGRIAANILLQQIADGTRENEEVKVKGELIISRNMRGKCVSKVRSAL